VVCVHEQEGDGLQRHQAVGRLVAEIGHGKQETADRERRRQRQPDERDGQQHGGHSTLDVSLTAGTGLVAMASQNDIIGYDDT